MRCKRANVHPFPFHMSLCSLPSRTNAPALLQSREAIIDIPCTNSSFDTPTEQTRCHHGMVLSNINCNCLLPSCSTSSRLHASLVAILILVIILQVRKVDPLARESISAVPVKSNQVVELQIIHFPEKVRLIL